MLKNENNIFKFATKELSQDAVIAWLINCYNDEKYKDIGENFIKNFIFPNKEIKIISVDKPKVQENRIDVFAKINTDIGEYLIIFEDKIRTFLHNDQLKKTINRIIKYKKNKEKIIYLLFKSSKILPFEEIQYKKEQEVFNNSDITFEIRNLTDMKEAIKNNSNDIKSEIYKMILEYYSEEKEFTYSDWISQMNVEQWQELYSQLINNLKLKKINVASENSNYPTIVNGGGKGTYRTLFAIEDEELINKLDKVMSDCKWRIAIDWGNKTIIKFICDVTNGSYKKYGKMTDPEKDKAEERKKFMKRLQEAIEENERMIAKVNSLTITQKSIEGTTNAFEIENKIEEIFNIIRNI